MVNKFCDERQVMNASNQGNKSDLELRARANDGGSSINFERLRDIVFIVAAFFGILAFIRTCITENKLEEVSYRLASIDHQPKLKIAKVRSDLYINTLSVRAKKRCS